MFTPAIWSSSGRRAACPVARRRWLSAARGAFAETRRGARRTNGLPHRPDRKRRRLRGWRRPRARQPQTRASCLAGLPRHRPGRGFPHEPEVRLLARRTVFRPAPRRLDRRSRDSSLDRSARKGEVIVPSSHESAAFALFGTSADHSFFTAEFCAAVAQSIAPRCQPIRRLRLSARGGANLPARASSLHLALCAAWVFLCSAAPFGGPARAEPVSIAGVASPGSALPFTAFVAEASQRFNIPANWIRAVMRIESAGDVRAISPKGAMGLMRIMPKTYAGLRARHHLGPDAYNPRDNILAGAAYLREMLDRYGAPGFLAAYNAGPARYDEHLATGRPLPPETQTYVAILSPMIGGRQFDDQTVASFDLIAWARATLFASHAEAPSNAELPAAKVQPIRSPVIHRVVDLSALSPSSEGLFVRLASETGSR